jgi:phosphohistidine phosphatase
LVVCSAATRAYDTAKLLSQWLNYDLKNIESYKSLYNPDIEILIDALTNLPKDKNNIILVNHNPAISYLVELLDRTPTYLALQPCAAVCLLFDVEDWEEINPKTGTVVWQKMQFN